MIKVTLKVMPHSSKRTIIMTKEGELKCYLHSPPEGGRANAELIDFLASQLGVVKRSITIVQGLTARRKVVALEDIDSYQEFCKRLGIDEGAQQRIC